MSEEQDLKWNAQRMQKRRTWTIVGIVLLILALPVLIPLALTVAGCALALALALVGGIVALCAGTACCGIGVLLALAALLICAVLGVGFGLVVLASTPGSGLAIVGASLMALGAGLLGVLFVYGCALLLWKAARALGVWAHGLFTKKKGRTEGYEA